MAENPQSYEDQLPAAQRWTNGFLENWIFAFILAMVIRQFFLEPFSIPSASMEPMLLGSNRMSESDHVVVNKLTHRFTEARRWDVTVFEFPIHEVRQNGRETQLWGLDEELDSNWLLQPLQHRSFVKRLVVLPGDEFYVSGGDIYVRGESGFAIARKPAEIQEVLWQCMYEHGVDEGYLPWSRGARLDEQKLEISPGQRPVRFEQPLVNLYMKSGLYRVHPTRNMTESAKVELSMLKPRFEIGNVSGNAWDLERWQIYRLQTKDLDSTEHGSRLNRHMQEYIGDVRVRFQPDSISGSVQLELIIREDQRFALKLSEDGWQLFHQLADGQKILHSGDDKLLGKACALQALDNQLWLSVDGKELHPRVETPAPQDPDAPCAILWTGNGSLSLSSCAVDRDVHYSRSGFLADLRQDQLRARKWFTELSVVQRRFYARKGEVVPQLANGAPVGKEAIDLACREAYDHTGIKSSAQTTQQLVRERLLGRPPQGREAWQPLGDSPENALTAPEGAYLLFGDNSPFSWDSRNWGWVPATNIRGRAAWVVFPFSRWKSIR